MSKRHYDIEGGYNIRDLGGYQTPDGGTIRWGKIYRAGILTHITDVGLEQTKELQVRTICDFRATDESEAAPDRWYDIDKLNNYAFPVGAGRPDKFGWMTEADLTEGDGHHLYKSNRNYVTKYADRFRDFFQVLLDETNYPVLFHCTAGKDRTGFAAMLLLSVLGVDWETIKEDYLLTNVYLEQFAQIASKKISKEKGLNQELVKSIFLARESYLKGAMDMIEQHHGTVQSFLQSEIGLGDAEAQQLKEIFVRF